MLVKQATGVNLYFPHTTTHNIFPCSYVMLMVATFIFDNETSPMNVVNIDI